MAWAQTLRRVPSAAFSQTLRDLTNQALVPRKALEDPLREQIGELRARKLQTFDVEARRVLAKEIWQLIKIRRKERWQAQQAEE
eukprot:6479800-Amphidinium_carterae.1